MYKNIKWIVQLDLINPDDLIKVKNACDSIGVEYESVNMIPFSGIMPDFKRNKKCITYGSISFNNLVYADEELKEGLFYDHETFKMINYFDKWGEHMLNYGAKVTTFRKLMKMNYKEDDEIFIRPNDDLKGFDGNVKNYNMVYKYLHRLQMYENSTLNMDSEIIVATPWNLRYEWRLWVINGEVIASSKYRQNFKLTKEEGCPSDVKKYAEDRCKEYTPHDVFVMDICECGDAYFIIEAGCMNGAGFYKSNIDNIIHHVTKYYYNKYEFN